MSRLTDDRAVDQEVSADEVTTTSHPETSGTGTSQPAAPSEAGASSVGAGVFGDSADAPLTVDALRIAVNASCECGGREPDDCCPACDVWHRLVGSRAVNARAIFDATHASLSEQAQPPDSLRDRDPGDETDAHPAEVHPDHVAERAGVDVGEDPPFSLRDEILDRLHGYDPAPTPQPGTPERDAAVERDGLEGRR